MNWLQINLPNFENSYPWVLMTSQYDVQVIFNLVIQELRKYKANHESKYWKYCKAVGKLVGNICNEIAYSDTLECMHVYI